MPFEPDFGRSSVKLLPAPCLSTVLNLRLGSHWQVAIKFRDATGFFKKLILFLFGFLRAVRTSDLGLLVLLSQPRGWYGAWALEHRGIWMEPPPV